MLSVLDLILERFRKENLLILKTGVSFHIIQDSFQILLEIRCFENQKLHQTHQLCVPQLCLFPTLRAYLGQRPLSCPAQGP